MHFPKEGITVVRLNLNGVNSEFNANSGLTLMGEIVASQSGDDVGLAHAGVPCEHHFE